MGQRREEKEHAFPQGHPLRAGVPSPHRALQGQSPSEAPPFPSPPPVPFLPDFFFFFLVYSFLLPTESLLFNLIIPFLCVLVKCVVLLFLRGSPAPTEGSTEHGELLLAWGSAVVTQAPRLSALPHTFSPLLFKRKSQVSDNFIHKYFCFKNTLTMP